jgi:hypothetical protein
MSTVNDLYQLITFDLCEDGGLVLGLLTPAQFIDLVNLTLQDFTQKTCSSALVQTQAVTASTARYTFPDAMMRVDEACLGGVLLEPTTVQGLNNGNLRGWRTTTGLPTRWHADELPLKTVELALIPSLSGIFIAAPQTGWSVFTGGITYTPYQHQDLTLIGPQLPAAVALLTDPLCYGSTGSPTSYIPLDFCLGYIGLGVLARIFGGDNELYDAARAEWCAGEYAEGCAIVRSMMGEAGVAGR